MVCFGRLDPFVHLEQLIKALSSIIISITILEIFAKR